MNKVRSLTKEENTWERVVFLIKFNSFVSDVINLNYRFYNQVEAFKHVSLEPLK